MDTIPGTPRHYSPAIGVLPADEARVFEDIIRAHPDLPEGVHGVEFRLGRDAFGTPAVWFVLKADDDLKPSKQKIKAYRDFSDALQAAAFVSDSDRFAYVRIETE
jgi:hypothetical protein